MAKGDDARARNRISYAADRGEQLGESLRTGTLMPNVDMFRNYFTDAANKASTDYGNLMGGFQDFAKTGGFNPTDISNFRARSIAPVRSMYANAARNVDRAKTLQGGYSPGYSTLQSRLAREGSQAASDASTASEAAIAEMVQKGKQFGLAGGSNLFGTSPGMAGTFGNQVLGATGQLVQGVGNEMQHGNDIARLQIAASQIPGKWEHTIGRINDVMDLGMKGASIAYPWLKPGISSNNVPSLYQGF